MTENSDFNMLPGNNQNFSNAKPKKKFYKRVWFWILLCLVVFITIFITIVIVEAVKEDIEESKLIDLPENEYREQCNTYTYDEIARYLDQYKGQLAKFSGEVVQVIKDGNKLQMRVNVTLEESGYYTDTVFVFYNPEGGTNVLEEDIIMMYGELAGEQTYKSIFGQQITIPKMYVKYIDVVGHGD